MSLPTALQAQVDALRARISALTPNASAEDLAMIAKALESLAGQVSVIDIMNVTQQQRDSALQALQNSQTQAVAAIEQARQSALQAQQAAQQQALSSMAQSLAQATQAGQAAVQPLGVTLSNAQGVVLPLQQGRAVLALSGAQTLALLPNSESPEQPLARFALVRNLTPNTLSLREQDAAWRNWTVPPYGVALLWASNFGSGVRWQCYLLAGLEALQPAVGTPVLQIGTASAAHRLLPIGADLWALWRLDTGANTLRVRLLQRSGVQWQVGSEQSLPFETNGGASVSAEVDLAVLDSANLVRVWLARGTSSGAIRMQRLSLSNAGVLSAEGSAQTIDWLNDNNIYDGIRAVSAGSAAVAAFWTRQFGSGDIRHVGTRITLSGSTLSATSPTQINSGSSTSQISLPSPYALAVRPSDGALAFVYGWSSSSLGMTLRQNNANFTSITGTSWSTSNKQPLGSAVAAAWVGSRMLACFAEHDAAQTLRWGLFGSSLGQLNSGTWSLPRAVAVDSQERRALHVVALDSTRFAVLVAGNSSSSSHRPLVALGIIGASDEITLSPWRELPLASSLQNIWGSFDAAQEALRVLADGWSVPSLVTLGW